MKDLTLIMPGDPSPTLMDMAKSACGSFDVEIIDDTSPFPDLRFRKILFAIELNSIGTNIQALKILSKLYDRGADSLSGTNGALLVHSSSQLYTKSASQNIIFLANRLGCRFIGHPVVEATGNMENFRTWQKKLKMSLYDICMEQSKALGERLLKDNPSLINNPSILALHSSNRKTSNTLELWHMVSENLVCCSVSELHVGNGKVLDCKGCSYKTCIHYGKQNSCFYGGIMVSDILPAIQKADAVVWICPNYNDALSANITAVINRLTALYRTTSFYNKSLFSIIVSGNSGSDSVAKQLIGALNINKGFRLPPYFSLMEIANDTGEIKKTAGIRDKAYKFAEHMISEIKS